MLTMIIVFSILVAFCLGCALWLWYKLEKAKKEKKYIRNQLDTANTEKKDALWLLYLSEISLLASVSVLYSERRRFYNLKHNSDETLKNYQAFHENVKRQTEMRLIRKGTKVALSFIPGLGLLDILDDIGEILSDADKASDFISKMSGTLETLTTGSSGVAIGFIHSTTDDDNDISADVIKDVHSTFQESFEEFEDNINASDSDELMDASKLKTFVADTIQSMDNLDTVKSIPEGERQMIIDRTLKRVNEFVDAVSDYNQVNKEEPNANAAAS